ncbi:MAG: cobyrinate a,c-diamide synthase [Pseudobutyrivibrio sp.]|nr:cobyrinate a,c-diamide synthase [Pseudobutyrivibrio sp.]
MIAAMKSGSGKTAVTVGILGALKAMGQNPCSFKCGPDYIDPMFHRKAIGIPAGNLDTYFTDPDRTRELFEKEYSGSLAILEGVMGLYDGVGGVESLGSSYDLATCLDAPIVLVVDAKGAGISLMAQIKGFLDYDENKLIKGFILNKTPKAFGDKLGNRIEEELSIAYIGTVESNPDLDFDSRHLGLVTADEIDDIRERIDRAGQKMGDSLDMDRLLKLAGPLLEVQSPVKKEANNRARVAIARDKAFCFYYRENIELLEEMGLELISFSPLEDDKLPENISGLILGGGYPENFLKELSSNKSMLLDIKEKLTAGLPCLAECGGFMYLMDEIEDKDGNGYEFCHVIPGKASWKGRLQRFGYVNIRDKNGIEIKGHEFHYYDTDNNGKDCLATKPMSDKSWSCIHERGNLFAGFPHLYYPSNPDFPLAFVERVMVYGKV